MKPDRKKFVRGRFGDREIVQRKYVSWQQLRTRMKSVPEGQGHRGLCWETGAPAAVDSQKELGDSPRRCSAAAAAEIKSCPAAAAAAGTLGYPKCAGDRSDRVAGSYNE